MCPSIVAAVTLVAVVGTPAHAAVKRAVPPCDVGSCDVATALEDQCPCEDATSHARYVRCVAHAAKRLVAEGTLAHHCRRRLVRFAAETACGLPNTAICLTPTSSCGDDGTCADDPNTNCDVDTDCGTRCEITTPDMCDAENGIATPQTGTCETAGCFSPSGAFLE